MGVRKDRKGMGLEWVKQVAEACTVEGANKLLKGGWILLDVGVVQTANKEGDMEGAAYYVFGREKAA